MHLLIHTQYYPPEIGAPQARLSGLAHHLSAQGHRVTVLTAMPSYPLGRLYPGYGGWLLREDQNGVRIVRTPIYPTKKAAPIPRLSNYFSFALTSWALGGWFAKAPDYILTESPPLFLGIAGYLLSRWKRARWIFNVSDLWPETALRLGKLNQGLSLHLSTALEEFCYRKAWLVTGQSQAILKNICRRISSLHAYHLSNGVDTDRFHPENRSQASRRKLAGEENLIVLYAGLHGIAQGLDLILEAAGMLRDHPKIKFILIGDGPEKEKLVRRSKAQQLHNIRFLDPVPKHAMPAIVASADICLVPLKTDLPGAVPSKIYEAMASARPVVLAAQGEAARIVSENEAGMVVPPGDARALTHAIEELAENPGIRERMGQSGREAAVGKYERADIASRFIRLLEASGETRG